MPNEVLRTPHFERALRRLARKNPQLVPRLAEAIRRMVEDSSDPKLKTHPLTGDLKGMFSCSVAYDCRIVFSLEKNLKTGRTEIYL